MTESVIKKFCPHCCNFSPQKVVMRHDHVGTWYDATTGEESETDPDCFYLIAICQTCDELLVYHRIDDFELDLLYPKIDLDNAVPEEVKKCYIEAMGIQKRAPNAYAVLIRRALETICDDRGVKKGSLNVRLDVLAKKGEIPPTLLELTNILRELGNAGAHSSKQSITVPMTWNMDNFFKTIVEYVYVAPSKLAEIKKRIK